MNHSHHTHPSDAEVMTIMAAPQDEMGGSADDDSLIVLDEPIILKGGQEFIELQLREPNVYHILSAAQVIGKRPTTESVYDSQMHLVKLVSGWPLQAVQDLPSSALDRAVAYVTSFQDAARRPEGVDPDLSPSMTLIFEDGIEAVGRTFSTMTLREPKVKERRTAKAFEARGTAEGFLRAEISLVENVSGWPQAPILKMPISKFAQAADYLTGFFMSGPETGTN